MILNMNGTKNILSISGTWAALYWTGWCRRRRREEVFLCRKGESSFLFEHSVHRGVRSKCIIVLNNKVVIIISKLQENIVIHSASCDRVMPADPLSLLLNTGKIGQKFFRIIFTRAAHFFIQTKSHGPVWQPTRRGPSAQRGGCGPGRAKQYSNLVADLFLCRHSPSPPPFLHSAR